MKRFALMLVCLAAGVMSLSAGGQSGSQGSAGGLTTLRAWGVNREFNLSGRVLRFSDWIDGTVPSRLYEAWEQELAKKGLKFEYTLLMGDQIATAFQTLLASGRLNDYDWIAPTGLDERTRLSLVSQNRLFPLNKAVEQYSEGPAKTRLSSDPNMGKMVKQHSLEDGNLYWLPQTGISYLNYQGKRYDLGAIVHGFIRKDWLDKAGLGIPKTLDDFYNALVAFRTRDINGNGVRDEVIVDSLSGFDNGIGEWFGLGAGGIVAVVDNRAVSPWYQAHVRDYIAYMNKLYTAGLIQVAAAGTNTAEYTSANRVGFHRGYLTETWTEPTINTPAGAAKAHLVPLVIQAYPDTPPLVWSDGALATSLGSGLYSIPSGSKNVDKMVKVLDFMLSPEYPVLSEMGIEGYTFTVSPDGSRQRLRPNADNVGLDQDLGAASQASLYTGWGGVFTRLQDYDWMPEFNSVDNVAKELGYAGGNPERRAFGMDYMQGKYKISQNPGSVQAFPTAREIDRIAAITTDLNTYSSELLAALIMGEKSLSGWDGYIADLKRLGLDDLISISQARIDRMAK
ncbi:MAG: extracellular solute-binding protein [Treponema sp.]|nr:extracellular solute-binding protein [Treponema sp.]